MKEDPTIDNLLKEIVKSRGISSPGADFVPKLLHKTRQKPLIPKIAMVSAICLFFLTLFLFIILSPNVEESSPIADFFKHGIWLRISIPKIEIRTFAASSTFSMVLVFACFPIYLHFLLKKRAGKYF